MVILMIAMSFPQLWRLKKTSPRPYTIVAAENETQETILSMGCIYKVKLASPTFFSYIYSWDITLCKQSRLRNIPSGEV